jgi:hypothetical protein
MSNPPPSKDANRVASASDTAISKGVNGGAHDGATLETVHTTPERPLSNMGQVNPPPSKAKRSTGCARISPSGTDPAEF